VALTQGPLALPCRIFAAMNRVLTGFVVRRAHGLTAITDPFLEWGLALAAAGTAISHFQVESKAHAG
jgi:hypothetical protein